MRGEQGNPSPVPKPVPGVDLRALPIGPVEAFVLSRVDGRASEAEIALVTGLPAAEVRTVVRRLGELGAVLVDGVAAGPPADSGTSHTAPPPPSRPSSGTIPVIIDPLGSPTAPPPAYPLSELDDAADLERDRKHLILTTFHRLGEVSHYELLNVASTADKKTVKSAYFERVSLFHPDKYFGKSLGNFKSKLETIFKRVTEAHDTLTRQQKREEYDQYLASQRATRGLDERGAEAEIAKIRREMEREARLAASVERPSMIPPSIVPPPRERPSSPELNLGRPSPVPASSSSPPADLVRSRPLTPDERRRALARKLGASNPPRTNSEAAPPIGATTAHEAAADNLKRRFETRLAEVQKDRVKRYVQQAEEAMRARNPVAAANALRIALSLAPDDPALSERFEKVEQEASTVLADKYLEQAKYDEKQGHYLEAARTYEKVLRGRPSAQIYERTAFCYLEAAPGEAKKAGEFAKKAVELGPNEVAYRITLARVYARAGMAQSALGELERARALSPGDDTIKDWIKRVKRGEV